MIAMVPGLGRPPQVQLDEEGVVVDTTPHQVVDEEVRKSGTAALLRARRLSGDGSRSNLQKLDLEKGVLMLEL